MPVPAGYTRAVFTHLPSPTVFIDADHSINDEPLGFWLARTLGNQQSQDAEKGPAIPQPSPTSLKARHTPKRHRIGINSQLHHRNFAPS